MPYVKYCMQDTGRIWHTVFCVVHDYIKLTKQNDDRYDEYNI